MAVSTNYRVISSATVELVYFFDTSNSYSNTSVELYNNNSHSLYPFPCNPKSTESESFQCMGAEGVIRL